VIAEFAVNNKIHSATKISLFMANYGRELRIGADIRRKEKVEKVIEFAKSQIVQYREQVGRQKVEEVKLTTSHKDQ